VRFANEKFLKIEVLRHFLLFIAGEDISQYLSKIDEKMSEVVFCLSSGSQEACEKLKNWSLLIDLTCENLVWNGGEENFKPKSLKQVMILLFKRSWS